MQRTARAIAAHGMAACLLLPLAGCALRHDQIAPEPIDPSAYAKADCRQLAQMQRDDP